MGAVQFEQFVLSPTHGCRTGTLNGLEELQGVVQDKLLLLAMQKGSEPVRITTSRRQNPTTTNHRVNFTRLQRYR